MNHSEINLAVARLIRQTLLLPDEIEISPRQLLFYDLNFTSLDFLDLLFRIEEKFHISIPEGTIYGLARGDMEDHLFAQDGLLTPEGRRNLANLLSDTPPEIFPDEVHVSTLPRYCTVSAIVRLVTHLLGEQIHV